MSGSDTCLGARLGRVILLLPSCLYGLIVRIRNRLYDRSILSTRSLNVPVICVGNITAGGTGKTPLVIWLCRWLQKKGLKVVILTRSYHAQSALGNDETLLLRDNLPDVEVLIDADRIRGGRRALKQFQPNVLVLDDGFQHRRLRRDIDIVVLDCTCPFGFNKMLPGGLLREPVAELARAQVVVLTRSDLITEEQLDNLAEQVRQQLMKRTAEGEKYNKIIATSRHQPVCLFNIQTQKLDLNSLTGRKVYAFCGIGNPDAFLETLKKLGAIIAGFRCFADHQKYNEEDLTGLTEACKSHAAEWLITTEKDWMKLKEFSTANEIKELYWLKIELTITTGEQQLNTLLENVLT
jgi:tetraacyldisaccharide 4'-kinase